MDVIAGNPLALIARRYVWSVPVVALLGLCATALEGLGISLVIPLVGGLISGSPGGGTSGPAAVLAWVAAHFEPSWKVPAVALVIFCSVALKGVLTVVSRVLVAQVDGRASHEIRSGLANALLHADYQFLVRHDAARLVTIISTDAWRASDAIKTVFGMVSSGAAAFVFFTMLVWLDWRLSILVGIAAVAMRFAQTLHVARLSRLSSAVTEANNRVSRRMLATIDLYRLIKIFGQERTEETRFRGASGDIRRALLAVEREAALWSPLQEVVYAALFLGIVLWTYATKGDFSSVATFLLLLFRMQPYLMQLSNGRAELAATSASVREVQWLLGPAAAARPSPGRTAPTLAGEGIRFDKVSFGYSGRGGEMVLDDVSFRIPAHQSTALVGRSGAGKSTIINLLCGLVEPTGGTVLVDGTDLREIDLAQWRRRIGVAGQDIDLFDGTIAENIAYGRRDADLDAIRRAAREADADGFIEALPEGYESRVGHRGVSLSGGQRQRIGIARALLVDPELLILDEATNAVDGLSERAFLDLLRRREKPVTTVIISHRASTIRDCASVVVFEGGAVLASGAPETLDKGLLERTGVTL